MMVLAAKLHLCSAQCDITAAFVHSVLPPEEQLYVHQPRGFVQGSNCVLKLRRSVYGLRQAPQHFFHYLSERLQQQGLKPSDHDPCLFLSKDLIAVVYVDDLLIWAANDSTIEDFIARIRDSKVQLR